MEKNNDIPIFPIDVFPAEIIDVLLEYNKCFNFPIEYLGSSIMSAAALAIGNTHHIRVKDQWVEKAVIFMVLVGKKGDVKTHPLRFAFKPIEKKDNLAYEAYLHEYAEYEKEQKSNEAKTSVKPTYKKYELKDFTPESLVNVHKFNKRGVVIRVDELSGWIKNFGRYTNKSSEAENYMSIWSGDPISVDRKGDEPIRINNPFINVIGTMQKDIIKELGDNNRSKNGFIERLLFVVDENMPPMLWNEKKLSKETENKYNYMIERLFDLDFDDFNPNILNFSSEAKKLLIEWQNGVRLNLYKSQDDIGLAIQAKLEVYTIRFSLVLQLMFWAVGRKDKIEVEKFAVEKAIKLTEYFRGNARKIHNKIYNRDPLDDLPENQKQLYFSLEQEFTTNQAITNGLEFGIAERTVKYFIKRKDIFKYVSHGKYEKL